ncbi:MAG: TonB family protein [Gemmatimonadetes bacterium]|nr:TonB family protein [Gemmatimonadota bacterium]
MASAEQEEQGSLEAWNGGGTQASTYGQVAANRGLDGQYAEAQFTEGQYAEGKYGEGDGSPASAGANTGDAESTGPVPIHMAVPSVPREVDPGAARGATVQLRVHVDVAGDVIATNILRSSGMPALDEAAAIAARRSRFMPATAAGSPVEAWTWTETVF